MSNTKEGDLSLCTIFTRMKVLPLGAGQDVGRSCIIVTFSNGSRVMFDCGVHMGFSDARRFPDFSKFLSSLGHSSSNMSDAITVVLISHFHLDHSGSLPFLTEKWNYRGPIIMSNPTRAIAPLLLEDFARISSHNAHECWTFGQFDVEKCMSRVKSIECGETIRLEDGSIEITAMYAGHVIGAVMYHVVCIPTGESVVYTGDVHTSADRHLRGALPSLDRGRRNPHVLITETTYAHAARKSRRLRERDFLEEVEGCVRKGGKVLLPVFALGRAQELCLLLDSHWERKKIRGVPIYLPPGMVGKANIIYQRFLHWSSLKSSSAFVFPHTRPLPGNTAAERDAVLDQPGPAVVFATPGMLHAGLSLHVFTRWAQQSENLVLIPGYCVKGTAGHTILNTERGSRMKIPLPDGRGEKELTMRCKVKHVSFSAHADARGLLRLINQMEPQNVVLVHGEKDRMSVLQSHLKTKCDIPTYCPVNGEQIEFDIPPRIVSSITRSLVNSNFCRVSSSSAGQMSVSDTLLVLDGKGKSARIVSKNDVPEETGVLQHRIRMESSVKWSGDELELEKRLIDASFSVKRRKKTIKSCENADCDICDVLSISGVEVMLSKGEVIVRWECGGECETVADEIVQSLCT